MEVMLGNEFGLMRSEDRQGQLYTLKLPFMFLSKNALPSKNTDWRRGKWWRENEDSDDEQLVLKRSVSTIEHTESNGSVFAMTMLLVILL